MRECQSRSEQVSAPGGGGGRHRRRLCSISVNRLSSAPHPPLPPPPSSNPQLVSHLLAPARSRIKQVSPPCTTPQCVTVSVSRDCCSLAEPSVSAANHAATFVFGLFLCPNPGHMQSVCSSAAHRLFTGRGGSRCAPSRALAVTHVTRVSVRSATETLLNLELKLAPK